MYRTIRGTFAQFGFSFRAPGDGDGDGDDTEPRLKGTEMWLATIWYLADLIGASVALGYRPRGVHRPEAGGLLTAAPKRM